jgi:hypothetical protein
MVYPYLRRRAGEEPVVFPKLELKKVLGKTSAFRSSRTEDAGGGGAVAHHFAKGYWDSCDFGAVSKIAQLGRTDMIGCNGSYSRPLPSRNGLSAQPAAAIFWADRMKEAANWRGP